MARRLVVGILAGLVALGCSGGSDPDERAVRVVLVTLDTLRADALASMPRLAARAESGRRFPNAFAASPATQPTHASLFTGLHPWQHGVSRNGLVLDDAYLTVAERLKAAGFTTAAVVSSFPLLPRFGFAQGFDVFAHRFDRDLGAPTWQGAAVAERFYQTAGPVSDDALRLLAQAEGPRQFFWFHYFDPHEPYGDAAGKGIPLRALLSTRRSEPAQLAERLGIARKLYARDLRHLDEQLERVFRALEARSDHFETHVIVTADHGESFGEAGALGHGGRVTREQIQVPLLLFSPRAPAGVDPSVAGSVDVGRTLLVFAGVAPDGADAADPFGGRDLSRPAEAGHTRALGMRVTGLAAFDLELAGEAPDAPAGPRFFLATEGRLLGGHAGAVFEEDDPERPLDAAEVRRSFAGFEAALAEISAVEDLDPETREGLRALGYVE
ncbi:MAG: sulfatase [Myxococcales bacterium]|nr:sulfatase [Myxococcales bacterium]